MYSNFRFYILGQVFRSKIQSICRRWIFSGFQKCIPMKIQNHVKILKFWKILENYLRQPNYPYLIASSIFQKSKVSKNTIEGQFSKFFPKFESWSKKIFLVGKLNDGFIEDQDFLQNWVILMYLFRISIWKKF